MEWEEQDAREEGGELLPSNDRQRNRCLERRLRRSCQKPEVWEGSQERECRGRVSKSWGVGPCVQTS